MDLSIIAFLPWVVSVAGVAALPVFRLARAARRIVGAKRNEKIRCALCNGMFGGLEEVHLFEGRYVCETCAGVMRRRIGVISKLVAGAGVTALVLGVGTMAVDVIWFGGGEWWAWHRILVMFAPPALILFGSHRSLRRLKAQNEQEQLEAASAVEGLRDGEFRGVMTSPNQRTYNA